MTWEMTLQNTFLGVVNLSITAGFVIVMVLVLRAVLSRVPKKFVCLLWLVVLFRLLCPVTLELPVSLVPSHTPIEYEMVYTTPQVGTDSLIINEVLNQTVNPILQQNSAPAPAASANPSQIYLFIASLVWIVGVIGLLGYTLFSWIRLRRQVAESEPKYKGVYLCGTIASPFVFGVIRPKIYLPYGMSEDDEKFVLLHERSHIARKDFIVKPLFWLAVMIHWMNPLVWVAWYYFGRDMELACDECAIDQLNDTQKSDYGTTLLQLATQPKCLHCPMAFGNNSVKQRIQRVLKYKKLPIVALDVALIATIALCACLIVDQKYYPYGEREAIFIERGQMSEEYTISKLWVRWGSVTATITNRDEIVNLKEKFDALQVKMIPHRDTDPNGSPYYEQIGGIVCFYDENDAPLYLLHTSISPDFTQVNRHGEGTEWKVKNSSDLKHFVQSFWSAVLSNYTDTTFYADLDHDGADELVVINVTEWEEEHVVWIAVYNEEGNVLFHDELYSSHVGWGNYFLYEQDGKDYLLKFMPTIYQGYATYSWQLMDFDWRGKLRVVEGNEVEFNTNQPLYDSGEIDAIKSFLDEVQSMLLDATLLVSVENGQLQYSTVNTPTVLDLSHYLDTEYWGLYWENDMENLLRHMTSDWGYTYTKHKGEERYMMLSSHWKEVVDNLDEFEGIGLEWLPYWLEDKKELGIGNPALKYKSGGNWTSIIMTEDGSALRKGTCNYRMVDEERKEYIYREIITFGQENDQWVVTDCEIAINYLPAEIYVVVRQIEERLEDGHDTWRKDPEQVVHHFLHDYLNITDEVQIQWNAEKNIMLCTTDETTYTVYLYKPIQAGTPHIFYAVSGYQYDELDEAAQSQMQRHFHVGNDPWASLHVEE